MLQLSSAAFDRARNFLKTRARPLERALYEFRFEGAPADRALAELARFQNRNGGFGHGLEPDLRTPTPSALATGIGLRTLKELGCNTEHPMVGHTIHWLLNDYNPLTEIWRVIPPDAQNHPRAPWWNDEAGSLERTFDGFLIIPRAELVGLLYDFARIVPRSFLVQITETTVRCIETIEPLGSGGGDDLVYALSLAQAEGLQEAHRNRLLARIRSVVPDVVSRDPGEWGSYCISPLKIAPTPQSPVADLIWDDLQAHLDYQIAHQSPEGSWDPVWDWGEAYPEAWEQARVEWQGYLTLETLTSLRAYGRIKDE
jgi:hypothetical protein